MSIEIRNDNKEADQREKELNRFCDLMEQLLFQISDDVLREQLSDALNRFKVINAE